MNPDPFAHGMPAGDDHTWVRPPAPPCPNCSCCTERLCQRCASPMRRLPCSVVATITDDAGRPVECPCSAIPAAQHRLDVATQVDPSNPDNQRFAASTNLDELYKRRNGNLIAAAKQLIAGGMTAGLIRDPNEPDWPVLVLMLPTGQCTWHLPRMGEHPDPAHYYRMCGLPDLDVVWDGHDTAEKYRRIEKWISQTRREVAR